MNFSTLFPSKFLKSSDFPRPRVLRIASVGTELMNDGQQKPVVYFQGLRQGLVLNKVNGQVLFNLFGGDTEAWHGQAVEVYPSTTDFQGKSVACIRLRLQAGGGTKPVAAQAAVESFGDLDDAIPF